MKQTNLPKALEIINRLNKIDNLSFKSKLSLQAPKVNDRELELISKTDLAKPQTQKHPTNILLGQITSRPPTVQRTPLISSIADQVRKTQEMIETPTPLVGGSERALPALQQDNSIGQTPSVLKRQRETLFDTRGG